MCDRKTIVLDGKNDTITCKLHCVACGFTTPHEFAGGNGNLLTGDTDDLYACHVCGATRTLDGNMEGDDETE